MLLYFRRLRKKLIGEGKFGKYIFYAIGEIIIVIIGIIVALQLNIWNQKRIFKKMEVQYYISMENQLNRDLYDLRGNMMYNQDYLDQFIYASEIIMSDERTKTDTLGKISLNLVRYSDFRRSSNVFQTLISSGEIKHIKNQRVIENLQELEEIYIYIDRLEEMHGNIILSQVLPEIRETFRWDPFVVENENYIFSYQFQNYFSMMIILMNEKKGIYQHTEHIITSTVELIEDELDRDGGG